MKAVVAVSYHTVNATVVIIELFSGIVSYRKLYSMANTQETA